MFATQDRLTIEQGGQVGIGTDAPSETLHVAGTFRADSGITCVPALGDVPMGCYTNMP